MRDYERQEDESDTEKLVPRACCQRMKECEEMFTASRQGKGKLLWTLWQFNSRGTVLILDDIACCPWCGGRLHFQEYRPCGFANCPREPVFAVKSRHEVKYCSHKCAAADGQRRRRDRERRLGL